MKNNKKNPLNQITAKELQMKRLMMEALERFPSRQLLSMFLDIVEKESETCEVENVISEFAKKWYDMVSPDEGTHIVISTEKLSMPQLDNIKGFLETEIFPYANEQATELLF
jgi:dihydroorotase